MRYKKTSGSPHTAQVPGGLARLAEILDSVDFGPLLGDLTAERVLSRGPRGYPMDTLWRAYLLSYVLNLPHTGTATVSA